MTSIRDGLIAEQAALDARRRRLLALHGKVQAALGLVDHRRSAVAIALRAYEPNGLKHRSDLQPSYAAAQPDKPRVDVGPSLVGKKRWTNDRTAIMRRDYPTYRPSDEIVAEINALPGGPITRSDMVNFANRSRLRRPPDYVAIAKAKSIATRERWYNAERAEILRRLFPLAGIPMVEVRAALEKADGSKLPANTSIAHYARDVLGLRRNTTWPVRTEVEETTNRLDEPDENACATPAPSLDEATQPNKPSTAAAAKPEQETAEMAADTTPMPVADHPQKTRIRESTAWLTPDRLAELKRLVAEGKTPGQYCPVLRAMPGPPLPPSNKYVQSYARSIGIRWKSAEEVPAAPEPTAVVASPKQGLTEGQIEALRAKGARIRQERAAAVSPRLGMDAASVADAGRPIERLTRREALDRVAAALGEGALTRDGEVSIVALTEKAKEETVEWGAIVEWAIEKKVAVAACRTKGELLRAVNAARKEVGLPPWVGILPDGRRVSGSS